MMPLRRGGQESTHLAGILRARFLDVEPMEHTLHALPSGAVWDVNKGRKGKRDKTPLALELLFEGAAPAAVADDDRDGMQVQQASNTPSVAQALQSGQGTTAARCVSELLGLPSSSQPSQQSHHWSASKSSAANSSSADDTPPRAMSQDMPPPPPPALPPPRRVPSRPAAQGSMVELRQEWEQARTGPAYAREALATADAAADARAGAFIDEEDLAAEPSERLGLNAAGSNRVAPFLTKLYDLVSHPGTDDIVRWAEDGSAFRIVDAQRLSTEVRVTFLSHTLLLSYFRPDPV